MKNFALIGAAGYIAPRHLQAIRDTGNQLICALDKSDSVGILDRYFDDVDFFTEFERFDRHIEKLRRQVPHKKIEYVSICSPNYLHDAHIRFALRVDADAICEKPLVLNPWNCDGLMESEEVTQHKVHTVLQLRVHPAIQELRRKIAMQNSPHRHQIDLTYITSRGKWYDFSWKGDAEKSGGIATNIGIHFFDMLLWIFGDVSRHQVHYADPRKIGGFIQLERADIRWFLSLDAHDLPDHAKQKGQRTYRSIRIDGEELEFSEGFTDLHTLVYREILTGNGYGIRDARPSIQLAYDIRHLKPVSAMGQDVHPALKRLDLI